MKKKRDRSKDGRGKSEWSWVKQLFFEKIIGAYAGVAARLGWKRGIGIDMHAGDGEGIRYGEGDLFGHTQRSKASSMVLYEQSKSHGNFDTVLCEIKPERRELLHPKFPDAMILKDHADIKHYLETLKKKPAWGILICDPCGPKEMGLEALKTLCREIQYLDIVMAFPHGGIVRPLGLRKDGPNPISAKNANTSQKRYGWMLDCNNIDKYGMPYPSLKWVNVFSRRHLVCSSSVITRSKGFHYRIMVASNFLPENPLCRWLDNGSFTRLRGDGK